MTEIKNDKIYRSIQLLLFSFLFVYILLRIIFTDTLHDEIATYMFYFYQGDYIGENIVWDANNHLLNSFIGNLLYRVFGDNIAVLRLPNLFAFVLYFFATSRLTRGFKTPFLKISGLVALNSIPFIMEYFGNARGYGLSLGFFAWALVHTLAHLKTYSLKSIFYAYLFLGLAISANITLILTSLIIMGVLLLYPWINKTARPPKTQGKALFLHGLFVVGLTPFVLFGFALKETGALYYGRLDGIWEVTGKSLSRYVLFFDEDWLRFAYLAVFGFIIFGLVILLRKIKFKEWLQQASVFYALLFFGSVIGSMLLAELLNVNYQEDRTGMYLVTLFILLLLHLIEQFRTLSWLQVAFLFFPLSFATHMSLGTSVFSPDDRLNSEFYETVKSEIDPEHSVMIYHILNWNWPYLESHSDTKASVALFDNPNTTLTDIIVTKTTVLTNPSISKLYDTIAVHEPSTYIAFKRKQPMLKIPLENTASISVNGNLMYVDFAIIPVAEFAGRDLQISVSGHLKTIAPKNRIQLIVESSNKDGSSGRHLYYSFETTYQGQLIDDDFLHHFIIEDVDSQEKEIKVYLWNRGLHLLDLTNVKCTVSELKSPENESR